MQPNLTLHHFVHPQWFEDRGAFTDETNIKYFVDYCCLAYRRASSLRPLAGLGFTVNDTAVRSGCTCSALCCCTAATFMAGPCCPLTTFSRKALIWACQL